TTSAMSTNLTLSRYGSRLRFGGCSALGSGAGAAWPWPRPAKRFSPGSGQRAPVFAGPALSSPGAWTGGENLVSDTGTSLSFARGPGNTTGGKAAGASRVADPHHPSRAVRVLSHSVTVTQGTCR